MNEDELNGQEPVTNETDPQTEPQTETGGESENGGEETQSAGGLEINPSQPFAYGFVEDMDFKTIPTQRNASYIEVPEGKFKVTQEEAFIYGAEAPTPILRNINGIEPPADEEGGNSVTPETADDVANIEDPENANVNATNQEVVDAIDGNTYYNSLNIEG